MSNTTRDALVTNLDDVAALGVKVVAYSRTLDNLERVTLLVRVDEVRNSKLARGWRDVDVTLILATPRTDPTGPADDELDGALEDVLDVLDSDDVADIGIVWSRATRATLDGNFPAYEIAATVTTQRSTTP